MHLAMLPLHLSSSKNAEWFSKAVCTLRSQQYLEMASKCDSKFPQVAFGAMMTCRCRVTPGNTTPKPDLSLRLGEMEQGGEKKPSGASPKIAFSNARGPAMKETKETDEMT